MTESRVELSLSLISGRLIVCRWDLSLDECPSSMRNAEETQVGWLQKHTLRNHNIQLSEIEIRDTAEWKAHQRNRLGDVQYFGGESKIDIFSIQTRYDENMQRKEAALYFTCINRDKAENAASSTNFALRIRSATH